MDQSKGKKDFAREMSLSATSKLPDKEEKTLVEGCPFIKKACPRSLYPFLGYNARACMQEVVFLYLTI